MKSPHFLKQSGFSLTSVLISIGMIGGISLAILRITDNMQKSINLMEAKSDEIELKSTARLILDNPNHCGVSFKTSTTFFKKSDIDDPATEGLEVKLGYANTDGTAITKLLLSSDAADGLKRFGKLTITGVKLVMDSNLGGGDYPISDSHVDYGSIIINYDRKVGVKSHKATFPMKVSMKTTSSGTEIISCSRQSEAGTPVCAQKIDVFDSDGTWTAQNVTEIRVTAIGGGGGAGGGNCSCGTVNGAGGGGGGASGFGLNSSNILVKALGGNGGNGATRVGSPGSGGEVKAQAVTVIPNSTYQVFVGGGGGGGGGCTDGPGALGGHGGYGGGSKGLNYNQAGQLGGTGGTTPAASGNDTPNNGEGSGAGSISYKGGRGGASGQGGGGAGGGYSGTWHEGFDAIGVKGGDGGLNKCSNPGTSAGEAANNLGCLSTPGTCGGAGGAGGKVTIEYISCEMVSM